MADKERETKSQNKFAKMLEERKRKEKEEKARLEQLQKEEE